MTKQKNEQLRGRRRNPDSFLNVLDGLEKKGDMIFVPVTQINRNFASSMITGYSTRTGKKFKTVGGMITKGTTPKTMKETVEGFWLVRQD